MHKFKMDLNLQVYEEGFCLLYIGNMPDTKKYFQVSNKFLAELAYFDEFFWKECGEKDGEFTIASRDKAIECSSLKELLIQHRNANNFEFIKSKVDMLMKDLHATRVIFEHSDEFVEWINKLKANKSKSE